MANLLRDHCWIVRASALKGLGALGAACGSQADEVAICLADDEVRVRSLALHVLGNCGSASAPHAVSIAKLLVFGDKDLSDAAVQCLLLLGQHASSAESFLTTLSGKCEAVVEVLQALRVERASCVDGGLPNTVPNSCPEEIDLSVHEDGVHMS
mmetsp:Transcript_12908/g.35668  ORF Transcript_12908/g.35668 Transcript_12908/m.35668 type:complete len:154 (+) Transcript_12908:125-586(+)